jgi:hypothetical protein
MRFVPVWLLLLGACGVMVVETGPVFNAVSYAEVVHLSEEAERQDEPEPEPSRGEGGVDAPVVDEEKAASGFGWSAAFLALLIFLHRAPDQKMRVVTASVRSVEGFVIVEECADFDTAAALLDANTVATVSVSRVHFVEE